MTIEKIEFLEVKNEDGFLNALILRLIIGTLLVSKWKYNFGQNICRLFHVLAQFAFTTTETELEYYCQKVNVRVAERLKT